MGRGPFDRYARRVDLGVVLARPAEPRGVAAPRRENPSVGHQDRGGVVVACRLDRGRRRPRFGRGVPDFGRQDAAGDDALVTARLAADRQHRPVGEGGERVVDAREVHRRGLFPFRARFGEVDGRGARRRGGRFDDARSAAGVEDLAGPVHDRGPVDDAARANRGPAFLPHVEQVGDVLGGADREHFSVRDQERERILFLVDLGGRHFAQRGPGVRGRVVDFGRVRPRGVAASSCR